MVLRIIVVTVVSTALSTSAMAQESDTTYTPSVVVSTESPADKSPALEYIQNISAGYDDLVFELPINFRSGGINDFASISIRGAGMNQSKVLWNGIPLNSALSGIADVSLLQNKSGQKVSLYTSTNGVLQGDQAVGGVLSVTSPFDTARGLHMTGNLGLASFRNLKLHTQLNYKQEKSAYYLALDLASGQNRYPFPYPEDYFWLNSYNLNGEQRTASLRLGTQYKTDKSLHEIHYWYNDRNRQLSPLVTNPSDSSYLQERFHRIVWNMHTSVANWRLESTVGLVKDGLQYSNPKNKIYGHNRFEQYIWNTQNYHRRWKLSTDVLYAKSRTEEQPSLWQWGASAAYTQPISELASALAGLRLVHFNNSWNLVPSASLTLESGHSTWLLEMSKVYRNPNINELYYTPGGNPHLRAEQGWNANGTWTHKMPNKRLQHISLSAYSRSIDDWVLWYGAIIFRPYNIGRVWSRGVEFISLMKLFEYPKLKSLMRLNANLGRSTLQQTEDAYFEDLLGAQLPYTPELIANISWEIYYQGLGIKIKNHLESARNATLNTNWKLQSFYLLDIDLSYKCKLRPVSQHAIQLSAGVKNTTNTYYQYILNRPMPGRNFYIDLAFFL